MIIGIGSDLANIERIGKTLETYGERFVQRVFTPVEQAKAAKRANKPATYAKRFAAKEACAKALGTGLYRGVFFRDMGVVNLPSGQPTLELSGGALKRLRAMTPPGMTARIHLTITDDAPWAQAFVVIEANKFPE
ncbi:MAG: holo-ACP synthase [Alphaproteobacteria bacterium]|nr:holo-ACP synthase [Alphaproteobacteria bacterium]